MNVNSDWLRQPASLIPDWLVEPGWVVAARRGDSTHHTSQLRGPPALKFGGLGPTWSYVRITSKINGAPSLTYRTWTR